MLDIILGLLELLLELVAEAALQFAVDLILDLILRGVSEVFGAEFKNPRLAFIGYLFLGAVAGGLSLLVFPHPLVHPSRLVSGISVILSPILAGAGMWALGCVLRQSNKKTTQIESFVHGFGFAFGMALIRFLFTAMK